MAKTYVLAGYDHNGAFSGGVSALEGRSDVIVIRPTPGESIADTIRKQGIAAGDNLVVASHGVTGGIEWNKGEIVGYDAAFKALPEGMRTIAVTSCFGGSAQASLASVPKGAVLQSLVGSETVNVGTAIAQFSRENKTGLSPAEIMLEALDNVDPQIVSDVASRENTASRGAQLITDPNKVLPHTIGIGGNPPVSVDLNKTLENMGRAGGNNQLNAQAMQQAAAMVIERFDTKHYNWGTQQEHSQGFISEAGLGLQVMNVAAKINTGKPLETLEEKRIGYGLAIAYLDKSGELEQLIQRGKGEEPAKAQAAAPAGPDVVSVQHFLNDMGIVGANGKPLTPDGIVGNNTRHAFMKFCEQNDLNPANGVDDKFQAVMQRYQEAFKSGALTKEEVVDIKETQHVLNDLTKGMSADQLSAIRSEFADMRNAMLGKDNQTQVQEEIGQLVAVTKNALAQMDAGSDRGRA